MQLPIEWLTLILNDLARLLPERETKSVQCGQGVSGPIHPFVRLVPSARGFCWGDAYLIDIYIVIPDGLGNGFGGGHVPGVVNHV